jgi:diaminopimelate epimerase
LRLQSPSGPVGITVRDDGSVSAGMGSARFAPDDIPLRLPAGDPYRLSVNGSGVEFGAVSMGNPHAVIEVDDVAVAPLATLGAALSVDPHFPQGCNVGFVQIIDRARVRLRVWERGAGATLACGTGACAAVAVLRRRGKLEADVAVELPGGTLQIHWPGTDAAVTMAGPTQFVFEGEYDA